MRRPRLLLRTKLLVAFGLVLLPVLVLLLVDFRTSQILQEESILRDQLLTAQAIAVQVDEAFDALIGFGWAVAANPLISAGDDARLDKELRDLVSRTPQVALIAVHDAAGNNRAWSGTDVSLGSRLSVADRPEFQLVMASNLPQVSDVLPGERLGVPGVFATVPLRDASAQPIGAVVVGALTDQLARRYEHARLLPGQAIFLVDRTGRLAFHTARRRLTNDDSDLLARAEPLRAALAGIASTQPTFDDLLGQPSLAAFAPTPKYRWAVGVTLPRSLALAPIQRAFQVELAAFAGILLTSVALAAFLARYLLEPVRRLEVAAAALGRGDLSRRVNIQSGDEIGRLGAAFDTMAAELTKLYEEQRRTLRLREDFMQAAAHELKTPIATIQSSIHLLLNGPPDEQARRTLEILRRQATRMTLLVEDLLTVTRVSDPSPELQRKPTDLGLLAAEMVRRVSDISEKHSLTLTSAARLVVDADRDLVSLVLMRLLQNAVADSPEGGPIEVAVRREGHDAVVSVVDHGVGIPVERQPHIFEPFYEAVPSGHPAYAGVVSLRLHLCKRIVDAHGGRIWVASGPGSMFCFSLPM
jgi:signal transduction histidine kinase